MNLQALRLLNVELKIMPQELGDLVNGFTGITVINFEVSISKEIEVS